jgi:hypothetical protein
MDWEKAEIGITKRAVAAAAPNAYLRIPFNILILQLLCTGERSGERDGARIIVSRHRP